MIYLVAARGARMLAVLPFAAEAMTLGEARGVDHALAGLPGRATVVRLGAAFEVRHEVEGVPAVRRRGRAGEGLEVGGVVFWLIDGPAAGGGATQNTLEALFQLARRCHARLDSTALFEEMMGCLLDISGAERGFILLAPAWAGAGPGAGVGGWVPVVSRKIDLTIPGQYSRSAVERVFADRVALVVDDAGEDPELRESRTVQAMSIRSVMAAPLEHDGQVIGVIYLDSQARRRTFAAADLELLRAVGEHAVAAFTNTRERDRLAHRAARLEKVVEQEVRREYDAGQLVARAPAMKKVLDALRLVAVQDTTILIQGESGTGKELTARAIHELAPRRRGPFVATNCMALSPELLESELFGHEKGAFTGAIERAVGRFELADGGTLFLDEIGELDGRIQVKLLRVLQERVIERVGSGKPRPVDVRLLCATHVDLEAAVKSGRFREDLYYRVAVFPLLLPPLRERVEDLASLAEHFIAQLAPRMGKSVRRLEPEALAALCAYRWPGNIRELRNLIERALVLETGPCISLASLPALVTGGLPTGVAGHTLAAARDAFERAFVLDTLRRAGGSISAAARQLDVPRSTIYRKLEQWGIAHTDDGDERQR